MKIALVLAALVALIAATACGGDDDASSPTPTATASPTASSSPTPKPATPTATPKPSPAPTPSPAVNVIAQLTPFGDFAEHVDTAVQNQDASFFSDLGVEVSITCVGTEDLGPCAGQPPGTVITGIPGHAWQSDAGGYTPKSAYNTLIAQWFASAKPAQTDTYGNGAPRLFAIAGDSVLGDYYAIVTEILDTGASTGIQRQARAFRFAPDTSGQFNLTGEILAAVSLTADDWLQGQCTSCYYDSFQTWP